MQVGLLAVGMARLCVFDSHRLRPPNVGRVRNALPARHCRDVAPRRDAHRICCPYPAARHSWHDNPVQSDQQLLQKKSDFVKKIMRIAMRIIFRLSRFFVCYIAWLALLPAGGAITGLGFTRARCPPPRPLHRAVVHVVWGTDAGGGRQPRALGCHGRGSQTVPGAARVRWCVLGTR